MLFFTKRLIALGRLGLLKMYTVRKTLLSQGLSSAGCVEVGRTFNFNCVKLTNPQ